MSLRHSQSHSLTPWSEEEIKALKESNASLIDKISDLGKKPSVNPVNTNSKPAAADTYAAWREQMRGLIG